MKYNNSFYSVIPLRKLLFNPLTAVEHNDAIFSSMISILATTSQNCPTFCSAVWISFTGNGLTLPLQEQYLIVKAWLIKALFTQWVALQNKFTIEVGQR